jgi:hypothetical protein
MPTSVEDIYRELRLQRQHDRRAWLREHTPEQMRAHWWWALLERAQSGIVAPGPHAAGQVDNVALAVELVEIAVDEGMPDYLGASWIARFARTVGINDARSAHVSEVLNPDNVARRILTTFQLTRQEAIEEAARRRAELLESEDAWFKPGDQIGSLPDTGGEHADRLQKVEYLMPELELVVEHVRDRALAAETRAWLSLRAQLEIGEDAANRGHELLARWREEQSRDDTGLPSSNGIE